MTLPLPSWVTRHVPDPWESQCPHLLPGGQGTCEDPGSVRTMTLDKSVSLSESQFACSL